MDGKRARFFDGYGRLLTLIVESNGSADRLIPSVERATHSIIETREKYNLHKLGRIEEGERAEDWYMIARRLIGVANVARVNGLLRIALATTDLLESAIEITKEQIQQEERSHEHAGH